MRKLDITFNEEEPGRTERVGVCKEKCINVMISSKANVDI